MNALFYIIYVDIGRFKITKSNQIIKSAVQYRFPWGSTRVSHNKYNIRTNIILYLGISSTIVRQCAFSFLQSTHIFIINFMYTFLKKYYYSCYSHRTCLGSLFCVFRAMPGEKNTYRQPQFKQVWARTCQLNRTQKIWSARDILRSFANAFVYIVALS